jgi:hypothetical protein
VDSSQLLAGFTMEAEIQRWAVKVNDKYWLASDPIGDVRLKIGIDCLFVSKAEADDYSDISKHKFDSLKSVPVTVTITV